MKIKTSEATELQLDWLVAKCEGHGYVMGETEYAPDGRTYQRGTAQATGPHYSTNWAQSGPILSRERISRTIDHSGLWIAYWSDGYTEGDEGKHHMQCDRSELVAGLRCVVARKLGDEVEVPDELQ